MPPSTAPSTHTFHALIRTHHITSRKKVSVLRAAARARGVACVLRSGGAPGLMYVRGPSAAAVQGWVEAVHALRYKDYRLVVAPAPAPVSAEGATKEGSSLREKKEGKEGSVDTDVDAGLEEVAQVKDFGRRMEQLGLLEWWRAAMGFTKED